MSWLENTVTKMRLAYFGHTKQHLNLEKIIFEEKMPGNRRIGRPKRRWRVDIERQPEIALTTSIQGTWLWTEAFIERQ